MHIEPPTHTTPAIVRIRRAAIAAVACAALVGACGSSGSSSTATTSLNTTLVAKSIEESVLSKRHLHVTVTCPANVVQEEGKTFVCTATSHSAKNPSTVVTTPFKVTVQNNKGFVTY